MVDIRKLYNDLLAGKKMNDINIELILRQLSQSNDQDMRRELSDYKLAIDDFKYQVAFSSYGLANKINELPPSILQPGNTIPDPAIRGIQHSAVTLFVAYTAFVYMRSNHLEKGLDQVKDNSVLAVYKRIFRSGSQKRNEDTLAQHIRNSLCHGTFEIQQKEIIFTDYEWRLAISITKFIALCDQIYRLYQLAFEAKMQPANKAN